MQEAKEILTREYIKRVLMDMIDRQAFLNLVAPYRVGTAVNFEQMKEAGVVDTYNLFAYLTTASSLKKTVLESMIADYSSDSSKKEELKSKQEKQQKRLEKLQEKIGFTPQNGGLIDELEEANGLSNIMIGEEAINTTNKTLEEQITIYQEQLKNILQDKMREENPEINPQNIITVCREVEKLQSVITEFIEQETKSKTVSQSSTNYQKTLTQD